ncbi:hydrogenase maturation protein [Bradyrhizobium diazoefficiens USDA 110]|uniref:Carbamoyltransferase HypF n=2 Tax=Bradyrhizobium diazoefficiens TaxID=1355477 RepID=Q89EX5_BRADU|nr:carbamoyltransferase HypF [Bradyrhizobium diazoefficiens]AND91928.1 carbamoyltransferase [Bradyrhizobium diazoefficiens USDA 110]PDT61835.1 carbamoyltransferase HypF [Bradyrhizobium diazoefficiens]QBP25670.1 carbamoyltransferase HypF [Bradyrhizobium diazoefficiens]QLD41467.1 carbamoyltransferase HypF [Bradyrhizobium diazoefficiens]WLA75893.1 carbamoyltransferase HypF [Bradyrhizobium diazoefficiens]
MTMGGEATALDGRRLRLHVRGAVQGVGFRPYVYGLATRYRLGGFVANDPHGVIIEVEGERASDFVAALPLEKPPLARIDEISVHPVGAMASEEFCIRASKQGRVSTRIVADAATCPECLSELFDPASRFHRYPFVNCTHCGPRYTIAERLPYDRPTTAMKRFAMCKVCADDYADARSRRFHAEAIACPQCGPRLSHEIQDIAAAIAAGKIVAIKGLGGYQLICDARDEAAVQRLRQRKERDQKPFAVMVGSVDAVAGIADADAAELALLEMAPRPIVLMTSRHRLAPAIAPGLSRIGIMLPVTPLHHLIFEALNSVHKRAGESWATVATSANPGGEPLLLDNREAELRLAGIADLIVTHDRDIVTRADDSVAAVVAGRTRFIRRARGYVPEPVRLAQTVPPILAVGGALKSTVTVTRGNEAFVSQHIGDLDTAEGVRFFEETVGHLLSTLDVEPVVIAHDLHPNMASTRFAEASGKRLIAVQHHHAHAASVMAEHGLTGPALALVLDGFGQGSDGGNWGGELLLCQSAQFRRLGHLAPMMLPGGDRAAREPWRMAASVLHGLRRSDAIATRFAAQPQAARLCAMLEQPGVPVTTSAGRLFDAAAGLLGLCPVQSYEGEAAMKLEAHVRTPRIAKSGWTIEDGVLSLFPLLARLAAEGIDPVDGAGLFHGTLAAACVDWIGRAARETGITTVALSGGCFLNAILSSEIERGCIAAGLSPLLPRQMPPNDGGLSLGQAWIAALKLLEPQGQEGTA